jgi:hypothetical protein
MKRLPLLILGCALAAVVLAGCGGGGAKPASVSDTYAQAQIAACAKVQKRLAAIKRPKVTANPSNAVRKRESKALQRYALEVDRALLAGRSVLGSVPAPPKLEALRKQWLAAVRRALEARLRLDTAKTRQLQKASRAELKARRSANSLAGRLGIANGCTLTY